jgi:predicted ATPase
LLQDSRLLTLTGPGGCGKTRLALVAASDLAEGFEDGAWLVELASLADPALVQGAVASTLGVRDQPGSPATETLSGYLRTKELLLVLDNCEHLVEACAVLAEVLLRACPNLRILATSREAMGVAGETRLTVPRSPCRIPAAFRPSWTWCTTKRLTCSWNGRRPSSLSSRSRSETLCAWRKFATGWTAYPWL